uniref:Uncharacterized protein n=1 Tax=Anguilla anguilla TaxID=7936 RepID=A0A0E9SM77_ANGAN
MGCCLGQLSLKKVIIHREGLSLK